jgi:glucose/arabinose dehydrogenase
MLKTILVPLTLHLLLLSNGSDNFVRRYKQNSAENQTGTLQKMMVATGNVAMDIDLNRLNGIKSRSQISSLRFGVTPDSFFTILVFNDALRGPLPGSMALIPQSFPSLPAPLSASFSQLVVEKVGSTEAFDIVVRDGKTGFVFFNIEGNLYEYEAKTQSLSVKDGRLLVSREFAAKLGRPSLERTAVGRIEITATMRPIEITQLVDGEATSGVMPSIAGPNAATLVAGPDVIVGDLPSLQQFGSSGTQVGLAVATDSCNAGAEPLHWFALPNNDHPVIPQNIYRVSGGATNNDRIEQIGQSWLKHAFTALQDNICNFGCQSSGTGTLLGAGCSDPYSASLNAGQNSLGARAWVNPFTGAYPGSSPSPRDHTGHTHTGTSHRILVEMSDLNTTLNPGATYYAEAQYVTPHEYVWCQAHPGQCNMYNNTSHRRFNVSGTTSFSFSPVGDTVQTKPAITAWPGATVIFYEPAPGSDGILFVGYKVTNPSPNVWHYEYAVYNQNLDRGIQSFSVPLAPGVTLSNIGFHAPLQAAPFVNDGTVGGAGYSNTPWTPTQAADSMTWTSETFAQNQNANAIRWGTLYNFRFDSNRPPQTTNATVGFYKTGAPILAQIQSPSSVIPSITISDVSVAEGAGGTTSANFTVNLSASSTDTVTVQYATADGLATAGSDYVAASGTVTFIPGQISQPVSITVNGDGIEEPNETFFVNLTNAVNGTITDPQGVGTINNDEVLASLPANFGETQIPGLSSPTAMAIHPDGRIFVCQQAGALRVIKNGALLATPFTTISVNSSGERGLLGIAFDPNYASNRFIYVYYTTATAPIHNRVSRFTADIANQDVAVVGSETILLDLDNLSGATNHNGGAMHFGPDGKLYIAVGENANSPNAQTLTNLLGKMLRMNSDGSIPADNPFLGTATGQNRLIWALGLRNPFTFSFQPGTGRMHINDVGQNTWEEVNVGAAGANYGWPTCEGVCGTPGLTNPIYQYANDGSTCAITGGSFYNPTTPTFPAQYIGKYFFADFCGGWLKTLDPLNPPATGTAPDFATGISSPVDIQTANDGSLYYLARGSNSVFRVQYFGGPTVAVNDVTITEGNAGTSVANFTVLLSPASAQTVTVQYATANGTAFSGTDYAATSGTVTFTPGQTSQPVSVTINGDTTFEPNEIFNVNLTSPVNATVGDSQGVGTITNDDTQPAISINDVAVTEGNAGTTLATFTVSITNASSQTTFVNYTTAGNTATSGTDFQPAGGTATITPGLLSQTIDVTVNGDTTVEPNESFFINLTNPVNATISDNQGIGTINNDDVQPTISINDVAVNEGNAGTATAAFTVSLSSSSSQTITVNYATTDNTATAGSDYVTAGGTVTFTPGQTSQPLNVTVNGDTTFEPTETFNVTLSVPANATIADNLGVGTITNDDGQPTISINDVAVTEGNGGTSTATFTVSLSNASSQAITVNYATTNGTATAGSDYVTAGGTVTFTPGQSTQPVAVTINGDVLNEANETFNVNLSSPSNATIADNLAVGTINNDDAQPSLSINDQTAFEQNVGTTLMTFTVTLSAASGQTVTVNYATADGTATAGSDYVAAAGTLTFTPGQTTQPVVITINGDFTAESDETYFINLTGAVNATIADNQGLGTIVEDDAEPKLFIDDVAVTEGNAGTVNATFTVTLSPASLQTVTVQYATANGTALAGSDYLSTAGTLTFTPGQTSQPINVAVNGDTVNEANETFQINLTNPTNATLFRSGATGTITNDDGAPSLSINDVSKTEGNAGTSAATFTVTLSAASEQTVTVNFATADGTAFAGSDYVPLVGTLSYAPGDLSRTLSITINGDTVIEPDETFLVNLSSATNATIGDNQGQGTIVNDDQAPARFEFSQANFDQPESSQSLFITVRRTGDPAPAATVDFQTNDNFAFVECTLVNGIANQRCDYLSTSGTLTFAANEVEKTFRLLTYNDVYQEGNETINLSLSNPTGGAQLGPQGTATVTILDDDSGTPATNPIDGAQFFVRQHYADFLQRVPDQNGEAFWVQQITSCGSDPVCIHNKRLSTSNAFFFEPEYQQTAGYVVRLYRIAFGNDQPFRNPDSSDLTEAKKILNYSVFVKDRARVVGGANLAQAQLNLANAFVLRPEFLTRYPASLSGPDFVDALLATIRNDLGVELVSQRNALITLFNSGGRGAVMYRLADDNAGTNPVDNRVLIDAEYNRTFVFTEYAGYLRRNADIGGFKFWLGQVNSFPIRNLTIQNAMVCAFITSQEYQQRFSSIVTRNNTSCQ